MKFLDNFEPFVLLNHMNHITLSRGSQFPMSAFPLLWTMFEANCPEVPGNGAVGEIRSEQIFGGSRVRRVDILGHPNAWADFGVADVDHFALESDKTIVNVGY